MNESNSEKSGVWHFLNSPIVVVLFGVVLWTASVAALQFYRSQFAAKQFMYSLKTVAAEMNDKDKGVVKQIVSGFIGQVAEGFKGGFQGSKSNQQSEDKEYLAIRSLIVVSKPIESPSTWGHRQKFVGQIKNNSNVSVKMIKINVGYVGTGGELIDAESQWLSDIKLLPPKESMSFSIERTLAQSDQDKALLERRKAKDATITISGFEISKPD